MQTDEERRERIRKSKQGYEDRNREARNAKRVERYHQKRAAMTEEEKQAFRDQMREYNRLMKQKSRARRKGL